MPEFQMPFLMGERVYLRPIDTVLDTDCFAQWINDPEVRSYLKSRMPIGLAAEEHWIGHRPANEIILSIVLKEGDRCIGNIALHRINWVFRSATSGTVIGEKECWGRGYGTEAKQLLLGYAFQELGLNRVTSHVFASNPRSLRCQLRCGYREEGRMRKAAFIQGEWVDVIVLGVLAEEWIAQFGS